MRTVHHTGRRWVLALAALGSLAVSATLPSAEARVAAPEETVAPGAPTDPALMSGDLAASGARIYEGEAFDTCNAPPLDTMRDWRASPYGAVGVYIGGHARACAEQPHLTPEWVREVTAMDWRLLPIYVGSQSPCVTLEHRGSATIDPDRPWEQGAAEARDAIAAAEELGMAPGSPIYLDMEAYDLDDAECAATTLDFTRGFTRQLSDAGWIAGYYSSAASGVAHLERARRDGVSDLPQVLWYARWDVPPTLRDEPELDPEAWQPNRRIHQHTGETPETHGGSELHIDRNRMHAPVAIIR